VNNLAIVTIIDGIEKLYYNSIGMLFAKHTVWLSFPEVAQLSSLEVLHDNKQLLLLGQWKVIIQFNYVLMSQLT
jgi:hypothetical protein